jgi:hypothetical protein
MTVEAVDGTRIETVHIRPPADENDGAGDGEENGDTEGGAPGA